MEIAYNNLPVQLTSFIGREREIAKLVRLLKSTRLLSLTGSGGVGKTRLALQVADELRDAYPNGVWFIDLAPLNDAALVTQTAATVFGLQEQSQRPIADALREYLREKHLLLLLDNCEHLIDACARFVDDVLRTAPHVSILATSRETLNIAGEISFRVPSLFVPDLKNLPPLESIEQSDAVRLFVARACAVQSTFALTEHNAHVIAKICQRLDGMPLAIELAAARVRAISIDEIAARLDDRFNLLTGGSRVALPRQQALRATMDWSYDLLSEPERALLRRLAVFAGGWTLQAAESVCAGDEIASSDVLDVLTRLVDKSLVIAEEQNGQARYRMLETIRQYAREKLIAARELDEVQDRHLNYFVDWAEMAEPRLHRSEQIAWLNRLEIDNDNLRAALEWSIENHSDAGLRLANALQWFWYFRGHSVEGCTWLERILAKSDAVSLSMQTAKAQALAGAGWLMTWSGIEQSVARAEASLELYRKLGDTRGMGIALCSLANIALYDEDFNRATILGEASAALLAQANDQANLHWTLSILAQVAMRQGNYARATQFYQHSLVLTRALGADASIADVLLDLVNVLELQQNYAEAAQLIEEGLSRAKKAHSGTYIALGLMHLAQIALHQGQYAQVVTLCEESLGYFRERKHVQSYSWSLDILGIASMHLNAYAKAVALFQDALQLNIELNYRQGIAENLAGLAGVSTGLGQMESATRLCGAAEALLETIGANFGPADREEYQRTVSALVAQLDDATFNKLWAEGRAMTRERAIDYVSSLSFTRAEMAQATSRSASQKTKDAPGGLTPRECDVAVLVARGKSNRDIAGDLVVSERTVEHHIGNMLAKLAMRSRSQLAAWVVEHGLHKTKS